MPTNNSPIEVLSIPGPKRVNYFSGQLLSVSEFQEEQAYFIHKLRQLNRAIFNIGIIKGLKLSCSGKHISVSPGFAMDAASRLVELPAACSFDISGGDGAWDIFLELVEENCDPTPTIHENVSETSQAFNNIQEVIKIWVRERPGNKDENISDKVIFLGQVISGNGIFEVGKT